MRLAIIADDLTGAMDAAAPFAERGLDVRLALSGAAEMSPGASDVVAFDTHSRDLPPAEAAAAVARCVAALPQGTPLFKKIDSTLRGAVVEEIRAAAAGLSTVVIAPAVPGQRRTVSGGRVLVDGVALGAAEGAGDAGRPFAGSLAAALAPLPCVMPDCATADDLAAIARAAPADALLVGAAGLAQAVAQLRFGDALPIPLPALAGPALFVAGSRTTVTARQLAQLRQVRPEVPIVTPHHAPEAGADGVARRLAQDAVARLRLLNAGALVLVGGDTARAVLDALGVRRLRVRGHIIPAIPWAEADIAGRRLLVATKAGGFGAPDALSRIAAELASR